MVIHFAYTPEWAHGEAVRALRQQQRYGREVAFHDVSGDDFAYGRLFARLWRAGDEFAIVEHDVVVRPDAFDRLDACPSDYCSPNAFCCVRFRSSLIAKHRDLPEVIGACHWGSLAAEADRVLCERGQRRCTTCTTCDVPSVVHLAYRFRREQGLPPIEIVDGQSVVLSTAQKRSRPTRGRA